MTFLHSGIMQYERPAEDLTANEKALLKVAKIYNVKLVFLSKEWCDAYGTFENGHSAGNEIMIDMGFKTDSRESAAFFHELGHVLLGRACRRNPERSGPSEKLKTEAFCWKVGMCAALKTCGVQWSKDTLDYAYERFSSYFEKH
jgi:hypothetical protein